MKIIRQFKQGRTAKSIYETLRMGDVFVLAGCDSKYIVGEGNFIISGNGFVFPPDYLNNFFKGEKIKAIYKQEKVTGDLLEDLLRAAENDIEKEWRL